IAALAAELGVPVTPVQSGFPDSGQYGVGSETVMALRAPRILLAAGDGVDQTSFGALWFYFERELGIPVIPVNLATLSWMNLGDYNTLIIPEGSAGRMWRELGEGGARRLKTWVEEGAAVIAVGDAVGLLGRKELGLTTAGEVTGDSTAPKDTT